MMKKTTFLLIMLGLTLFAFGQNRKGEARIYDTSQHTLYVAFHTNLSFTSEDYAAEANSSVPGIAPILQQYNFTLQRGINISKEKLNQMEASCIEKGNTPTSIQALRNIFKVKIDNPTNELLLELSNKLEALDAVVYCELTSSKPVVPPGDILPVTPNFLNMQSYMNANPGVNMQYAWSQGLTGAGIRVRDIEYGFNKQHEEFNDRAGAFLKPGMNISSEATTSYTEHGTAVFGVVYADNGIYGISGMAHGAHEMVLFPEWQEEGYDRVNAVSQAIANSVAGDVIIYEMQIGAQNNQFVPAEFINTIWDLTKAATDSGIVIVAAAGNGNQNLDSTYYTNYRNRGNSGAIIVGAGTSNTAHNKMSFSTYGARVDVQAWGQNVISSGYGDYEEIGGDFNQQYTMFSGTSSATPIVASCAIVLQSYHKSLTGNYMTPVQLRELLINTGIPQGSGGHIGPIPNMQAAIQALLALSVSNPESGGFVVYPNPVTDKINVVSNTLTEKATIEMANAIGQRVLHQNLSIDKTIDMSGLSKGIYFLKITENNTSATKKIIKN